MAIEAAVVATDTVKTAGPAARLVLKVDRTGIAWVRYSDGSIWKVSTDTLRRELPRGLGPEAFFRFCAELKRTS